MLPKVIFSDFDGTLTKNGHLSQALFDVLNLCERYGLRFVVVSGRSMAWGHFLLTHTHLRTAIMEGGGMIITQNARGFMMEEDLVDDESIQITANFENKLRRKFDIEMTSDSLGRRTDRAIDLLEFEEQKGLEEKVENYLVESKMNYSKSNVHLNFWHGNISKFRAVKYFLDKYCAGLSPDQCLFFGDSTNDEDMFQNFKYSVGVSNIRDNALAKLKHKPKVVLDGDDKREVDGVYYYLRELLKDQ